MKKSGAEPAFWHLGIPTNVNDHGAPVRVFRFKPPANVDAVYAQAHKTRLAIEHHFPNQYSMQVAVLDGNSGQWRSGKGLPCNNPNIYIWSPDDYDGLEEGTEFGEIEAPSNPNEQVIKDYRIYIRKL